MKILYFSDNIYTVQVFVFLIPIVNFLSKYVLWKVISLIIINENTKKKSKIGSRIILCRDLYGQVKCQVKNEPNLFKVISNHVIIKRIECVGPQSTNTYMHTHTFIVCIYTHTFSLHEKRFDFDNTLMSLFWILKVVMIS